MKLVHLSDTHLGYRAYSRITERGINQRELDVLEVFNQSLNKIVELDPDLVVITGDIFHAVRPSNYTLMRAYRFLSRFQKSRGGRPLVMIAGNHETPRSVEAGCIIGLFENVPGIKTAYDTIKWLQLEDLGVLCVPSRGVPSIERTMIHPRAEYKTNLLLIHGILDDLAHCTVAYPVPRKAVLNDNWDYIALGDYHEYIRIAENAYYSGSTDFTSSNIWEEVRNPKGFVEYDTETRTAIFHALETRPVKDLFVIDAESLTVEEVNDAILRNAERAGIEDAIVRQRVFNLRHEVRNALSVDLLRDLRARALHYHFDPRPPQAKRVPPPEQALEDDLPHERRTLADEWRIFLSGYPLPKEIEMETLFREGMSYLQTEEN